MWWWWWFVVVVVVNVVGCVGDVGVRGLVGFGVGGWLVVIFIIFGGCGGGSSSGVVGGGVSSVLVLVVLVLVLVVEEVVLVLVVVEEVVIVVVVVACACQESLPISFTPSKTQPNVLLQIRIIFYFRGRRASSTSECPRSVSFDIFFMQE